MTVAVGSLWLASRQAFSQSTASSANACTATKFDRVGLNVDDAPVVENAIAAHRAAIRNAEATVLWRVTQNRIEIAELVVLAGGTIGAEPPRVIAVIAPPVVAEPDHVNGVVPAVGRRLALPAAAESGASAGATNAALPAKATTAPAAELFGIGLTAAGDQESQSEQSSHLHR